MILCKPRQTSRDMLIQHGVWYCVLGADPYVIVKVEGQEVKLPIIYDSLNPEWNWRATFYRKKPGADIIFEVCKAFFYNAHHVKSQTAAC